MPKLSLRLNRSGEDRWVVVSIGWNDAGECHEEHMVFKVRPGEPYHIVEYFGYLLTLGLTPFKSKKEAEEWLYEDHFGEVNPVGNEYVDSYSQLTDAQLEEAERDYKRREEHWRRLRLEAAGQLTLDV